jgi:hypothetical protein
MTEVKKEEEVKKEKPKTYYVKKSHLIIEGVQYMIGSPVVLSALEAKAIGGEYLTTKAPTDAKDTEIEIE